MIDLSNFKLWINEKTDYSNTVISNIISRFKRADSMVEWHNDKIYLFELEQNKEFKSLSSSVKSQIKKAVQLYFDFANDKEKNVNKKGDGMKILSLFANIGVAEAYLKEIGFTVAVANELIERRALLYSKIYPDTQMICGDITNEEIFNKIICESKKAGVDIVMATPPCQGMSTVGKQQEDDIRNKLVCQVIQAIKDLNPKYAMIENVPMFFNTEIYVNKEKILIPNLLKRELGTEYDLSMEVIDTKNYSVPQTRERAIVLLSRKDQKHKWVVPNKDSKIVTMRDAIGHLPKLDPFVTDITKDELLEMFPHYYEREEAAKKISPWHVPPEHIKRQVVVMQHTPSGKSAFDNKFYYPKKEDGTAVKGFKNTYKRQNWDTPAYTVTMDNRKISSQNNVHPGQPEGVDANGETIYSDARALTLYELMIIMSIPDTWNVPTNTSEAFLRRIIGEGIPPLFVKKVFLKLKEGFNNE